MLSSCSLHTSIFAQHSTVPGAYTLAFLRRFLESCPGPAPCSSPAKAADVYFTSWWRTALAAGDSNDVLHLCQPARAPVVRPQRPGWLRRHRQIHLHAKQTPGCGAML